MFGAFKFLRRDAPDVIVLQWWTGAVLHTYLALSSWARRRHVPIVVEFHEVLDPSEAGHTALGIYSTALMRVLLTRVAGVVVHSKSDLAALQRAYGLDDVPIVVAPHGPYDHLAHTKEGLDPQKDIVGPTRLLFFGLIRPYKGLDNFLGLFNELKHEQAVEYSLSVVGETWEGYDEPARLIACSPHRERISFTNRYVSDEEVGLVFAAADALVLPYIRLSSSGPMSIAMSIGLPLLVSEIPEMREAVGDYEGAVFCSFSDTEELALALSKLGDLVGRRFPNTRSWRETLDAYEHLFASMAT